jgi:zinc/manganese transport system permease protein
MTADVANPQLSWNLARDASEALEYHFMVNALLAGSIVAVMAGLLGWFMVLRREAFAGHTLSLMAFPGASGAALIGVPAAWGYFACCAAGGVAIGRLSGSARRSLSEQSALIGCVQALALASGYLFLSLYGGVLSDLENLLFGTVVGISDSQVLVLAGVAVATLAGLVALGRPLLFASVDADVASARGVPARRVSVAFLVLLGLAVAETSQVTGVLLVFALLLMPAASAQAITARPVIGLVLTVALGLATVWVGLAVAYFSVYPAGFFITAISFGMYVAVRVVVGVRGRRGAGGARGAAGRTPLVEPPPPQGVIA